MVKRSNILISFISLFIFSNFLTRKYTSGINIMEEMEYGLINWSTGEVIVWGESKYKQPATPEVRLKKQREAREDAVKKIYHVLLNIRIKDKFSVYKYMGYVTHTNEFENLFVKFITGQKCDIEKITNEKIIVEYKIKLWGKEGLNSFLGLLTKINDKNLYRVESTNYTKIIDREKIPQEFTSLVIDASGIKEFIPSLFPEIYDEDYNLIYSPAFSQKNYLIKSGPARFISDITEITNINFVDRNSLIIRATGIYNKRGDIRRSALLISRDSAETIMSSSLLLDNLRKCRVVIVCK